MSLNNLILYPSNPYIRFNDRSALIDVCQQIGLVSESFDYFGELHFRPGSNFLHLITFINSHTVIKLEHSDGGLREVERIDSRLGCHLHIPEFKQEPRLWIGATDKVPWCPNCTFHIDNFPDVLDSWFADKIGFHWECPSCHSSFQIHEIDWQHIAGFARFTIAIWGVHYGEAVPSSELMGELTQLTGTGWNYLYYHL